MPSGISQCHHLRNDHPHHMCVVCNRFISPYAVHIKFRVFRGIYMFKLVKYPTGIEVTAYHGLYFTVNINGHTSYHDGKYYETCSDCLLSEDTTLLPDGKSKGRYLFLYSEAFCLYAAISLHTFCCGCTSFSPTTAISVACSFKARTGLLEPSHFETFKKQAECLEFPPLYHFVSTGESPLRLSVRALTSGLH